MNKVLIPFHCLIHICVYMYVYIPTHTYTCEFKCIQYKISWEQPRPHCSQMKAVFSLHRLGYGSRFVPIIPKNAKSNDMKNIKKWKKSQRTLLIDFTIFCLLIKLVMKILKP